MIQSWKEGSFQLKRAKSELLLLGICLVLFLVSFLLQFGGSPVIQRLMDTTLIIELQGFS
jgi:hypothetical protein